MERTLNLQPGTWVAPELRLVKRLGAGGMGVVYLAHDTALERDVAVKFVSQEKTGLPNRLLDEARAMARVRHDSVVEIYSFGDYQGVPYFVMEYVSGFTLEQFLQREHGSQLPLDVTHGILASVGAGLEAIHRCDTVHGDLKPGNVLIGDGFRVCIADFGLTTTGATHGKMLGTPAYLAPERIRGEDLPLPLSQRSDIYAFGVLAYQLLAGELPFDAPDADRIYAQHLHKAVPSLLALRPELTAEVANAVEECLEKDVRRRPSSTVAVVRAVDAARHAAHQRPLNILVIDDDPDFRALMQAILTDDGLLARVIDVPPEEATSTIARERFDLVITDLHMPGTNGLEITASLRGFDEGDRPRIIVVTGRGSASDWRVLREIGADAFEVKPIDPEQFLETVKRLLAVT